MATRLRARGKVPDYAAPVVFFPIFLGSSMFLVSPTSAAMENPVRGYSERSLDASLEKIDRDLEMVSLLQAQYAMSRPLTGGLFVEAPGDKPYDDLNQWEISLAPVTNDDAEHLFRYDEQDPDLWR